MESSSVEKAVELLVGARSNHHRLEALPAECRPATIEESYQIQDSLIKRLGLQVGGWKVGATSAKAQQMLGTDVLFHSSTTIEPLFFNSTPKFCSPRFLVFALRPVAYITRSVSIIESLPKSSL